MKGKILLVIIIAVLAIVIALNPTHIFDNKLDHTQNGGQNTATTTPSTDEDNNVDAKITYVNASADKITIELPFAGAVVGKEFGVIGKARGPWFFEASFPIELRDKDGKVLATTIATAQGEWMTEDFVPFKATMKAPISYIGPATLVLKRDNPSGLPEHDASMIVPITVEY